MSGRSNFPYGYNSAYGNSGGGFSSSGAVSSASGAGTPHPRTGSISGRVPPPRPAAPGHVGSSRPPPSASAFSRTVQLVSSSSACASDRSTEHRPSTSSGAGPKDRFGGIYGSSKPRSNASSYASAPKPPLNRSTTSSNAVPSFASLNSCLSGSAPSKRSNTGLSISNVKKPTKWDFLDDRATSRDTRSKPAATSVPKPTKYDSLDDRATSRESRSSVKKSAKYEFASLDDRSSKPAPAWSTSFRMPIAGSKPSRRLTTTNESASSSSCAVPFTVGGAYPIGGGKSVMESGRAGLPKAKTTPFKLPKKWF